MLNDISEFYPTPIHIVSKMLDGIDFKLVNSVLEPSAGKGDICDRINDKLKYSRSGYSYSDREKFIGDIDCIEINSNLQHILKGKGYRVVHDDFLTYETFKRYSLIVMNPPFSDGDKHLLKAIEMQEKGGQIVCLLNAETIKNTSTNSRKELFQKLQDYNADIQFIQDGFIDSEHRTGVEIALIKINIPKAEQKSYIFEQLKNEEQYKEHNKEQRYYQLVHNDLIESITEQYKLEIKAGIKLIEEYEAMSPLILTSFKEQDLYTKPILKLDFPDTGRYNDGLSINEFIKRVRCKYWNALFSNPQFTGLLTTNLQELYSNRVTELVDFDFSLYNIYTIKQEMNNNMVGGVEETILNLFEELSNKHSWYDEMSKNIHYYNGWKTNKCYIINSKVIIPLSCYSAYSHNLDYDSAIVRKLYDMEKVFNYLDSGLTEEIDLLKTLQNAEKNGQTSKISLKYFNVTFYKKGTCHIAFTNLDLLKKFNIFGSQHKGWLPPCYGKAQYNNMSNEEKAVIDEFEGKESYSKTMQNTDYFMFDSSKTLMLEAGSNTEMTA